MCPNLPAMIQMCLYIILSSQIGSFVWCRWKEAEGGSEEERERERGVRGHSPVNL